MDYLLESSPKEYGSGTEVSPTGYLIFGLVTFWIYTVWSYHKLLLSHFNERSAYFFGLLQAKRVPETVQALRDEIFTKGFTLKTMPRNVAVASYLVSMVLILSLFPMQVMYIAGMLSDATFDRYALVAVGIAALAFTGADIFFLAWACGVLKRHEYHELLFANIANAPETFATAQPSTKFIRRWAQKQNQIALLIIISIPMTISPLVAVWHVQQLIGSGGNFMLAIGVWSIVLFSFAGVFHLWGTGVLLNMFNDHLRIEAVNQQQVFGQDRWSAGVANSVLKTGVVEPAAKDDDAIRPKRALAAIMITDMVGFSKEMEKSEDSTYSKLLTHNEIIRVVIRQNDGEEIKTIGDAFLVRFNSAVDAVRAAVEIQNKLGAYNIDKAEKDKIIIRIGVHIGDVLIMGQDVIGTGVNIASRIEPLAEPGGICISSDVYNVVKKSIDIQYVNLGKKELKNIQDAPEIYKLIVQAV